MDENLLICVPGQRLCLSDKVHVPGQGTYERQGYVYSMLAGLVDIVDKDDVSNNIITVRTLFNIIK